MSSGPKFKRRAPPKRTAFSKGLLSESQQPYIPNHQKGKSKEQKSQDQAPKDKKKNYPRLIRDLKRLINKKGLDADVKATKEKELEALIKEHEQKTKEDKWEERYKSVRFFEKKKVTRKINQVNKRLAKLYTSDASDVAAEEAKLRASLAKHQLDLQYIEHFPRGHKYIALFPTEDREDPKLEAQRAKMRELVAEKVAELNGGSGSAASSSSSAKQAKQAKQAAQQTMDSANALHDDDSSASEAEDQDAFLQEVSDDDDDTATTSNVNSKDDSDDDDDDDDDDEEEKEADSDSDSDDSSRKRKKKRVHH